MPRGKFVPKEKNIALAASSSAAGRLSSSRIKLIKPETPSAHEPASLPPEAATSPRHVPLVFTSLLIAVFVLVNVALAILMKTGTTDYARKNVVTQETETSYVMPPAHEETPAKARPAAVRPAAPEASASMQDRELLSIISKE